MRTDQNCAGRCGAQLFWQWVACLLITSAFISCSDYSPEGLQSTYESNKDGIAAATRYFKSIHRGVNTDIEFGRGKAEIFHVWGDDKEFKSSWDIEYESTEFNDKLSRLGWTTEEFYKLEEAVKNADCISIASGRGAVDVGLSRHGMGKYLVKLFDEELGKDNIDQYNDSCSYLYYKENLVFKYVSGAIGSMCFPQMKK